VRTRMRHARPKSAQTSDLSPFLWHRIEMPQYRAFDRTGNLIGSQEISDSDTAMAWAIAIVHQGAALFERKSGDHWVCFLEYHDGQLASKKK